MKEALDPHCRSFQTAIDILARPWTGLILGLLGSSPLRFSEIEEKSRGVGAKTLAARLKDLEKRGIVLRTVDGGPPVRVEYSLTEKGRAFNEVGQAIQRWGHALVADTAAAEAPASKRAARR